MLRRLLTGYTTAFVLFAGSAGLIASHRAVAFAWSGVVLALLLAGRRLGESLEAPPARRTNAGAR